MRSYEHTQTSPLGFLLGFIAIGCGLGALYPGEEAFVRPMLLGMAGLFLLFGASFHSLTIRIDGDLLRIAFGPVPLFRKTLPLDQVLSATPGRSNLIDGWGVHWRAGKGWIWNLWGFDCVEITLEGNRRLRVGTDEPTRLARALSPHAD